MGEYKILSGEGWIHILAEGVVLLRGEKIDESHILIYKVIAFGVADDVS